MVFKKPFFGKEKNVHLLLLPLGLLELFREAVDVSPERERDGGGGGGG
jgi:hypothetical protein